MDVATIMDALVSYGFETDDELTDDRKLEALNEVYWDACSREAWPFLEAWSGVTIAADGLLQTNPVEEVASVQAIWFNNSGRVLQPIRLDDLNQRWPTWASDGNKDPVYYYFLADNIYVAPVPASDPGDGNIAFCKIPPELTALSLEADIVLPKRFHRSVLVIGTLAKLAMLQDDPEMGQQYDALYERQLAKMVDDVFKQQTDRPEYIHVNDWDNYDYS